MASYSDFILPVPGYSVPHPFHGFIVKGWETTECGYPSVEFYSTGIAQFSSTRFSSSM